ncbi:MAG: 50S ribosomal protein L4 [Gemmatimonadetes bacterium]|nr:50S ribosomal protein L4 [Gemmatimonadota bacterium]
MFKAPVITAEGKHGDQELPAELFDGTVHQAAMWQVVKAYLANQRQANATTKGRADVKGGNKKPWRQKGTGRARQGSIRAAQWRGGGSVFGPRGNRNYHQDVPKQVRWLARRSAYNVRAQDNSVFVIDGFQLAEAKTRLVAGLLAHVDVRPDSGTNVLLLTNGYRPDVHLAARNLTNVQVRAFGQESAYDLLWADTLIIDRPALERAAEVAHA